MQSENILHPTPKNVVIIGAGISGLSLAWFLNKKYGPKLSITILEQNPNVGGCIHTFRENGFLFESGPRGFRPTGTGENTLRLVHELKLSPQLIEASPSAAHRYLWLNERLQKLPNRFLSLFTSSLGRKLIFPFLREAFIRSTRNDNDESIDSFIQRRFGKKFSSTFMDPLISGVFAGDPQALSLKSCFPILKQFEEQKGSVIKGLLSSVWNSPKLVKTSHPAPKSALVSFKEGMSSLPKALEEQVSAKILLSQPVKMVKLKNDHVEIHLFGKTLIADHLFSTIPPSALTRLCPDFLPEVVSSLKKFSSTSLFCANLGYNDTVLQKQGFGYLIPSKEKENILGVTWDSSIFPQQNSQNNQTRLSVMLGGALHKSISQMSEKEILGIVLNSLHKQLGISKVPDFFRLTPSHNVIPQFNVGHEKNLHHLQALLHRDYPNFSLLGHHFRGIGINGCIEESAHLTENISL
jgi:protoporphyrinogen/coproporphyrinogen III oxidase